MLKKILPTLLAIVVALLLSACQDELITPASTTTNETTVATTTVPSSTFLPSSTTVVKTISREQAKTIALQHAGLADAAIRRVEAERDIERGVLVYEVEFDHNGYEYSYNIHAETGEILWFEKELDD